MFERPGGGERAVLVHMRFPGDQDVEEDLDEFRELVRSAGAEPVTTVGGSRRNPDPKFFVGAGKADEIRALVEHEGVELAIFNHALSPAQERNLERLLACRVLDRTGLILDIFAQRARSHEGKLQVELAQLRHMSTRLVRGWTHLERQKGGIGLRGPGETQLETDRRLLGERIKHLRQRLEKVQRQREQGRRARKRADLPTLSLVGYTNAGKSTLFNRLTESGVYAADQLFATLDPTLRRIHLPDNTEAILADTVGFIRHLPHDLVAAFRSTLQETRDAQLLLHVIDASDELRDDKIGEVNEVLAEIEAMEVPQLEVFNKIDLIEGAEPRLERDEHGRPRRVWLSAARGDGMDLLLTAVSERLAADTVREWLAIAPEAGRLRARFYELGAVLQEDVDERGQSLLEVQLKRKDLEHLRKNEDFAGVRELTGPPSRLASADQAT